jgi:fructose-1,6-bisphosphatase I
MSQSSPVDFHSLELCSKQNLMTLQSHVLAEESKYPSATGSLSWILSALSLSSKVIASKVRRARLEDVLGSLGTENVQGETQQKLDVIANETLLRCLGSRGGIAVVASEENEVPIIIRRDSGGTGRYCVLFDPLDGSSNIDTCGGVGTIFSILRCEGGDPEVAILQPGARQVAAGYVLYGSSTVLVLTTGFGVSMFVLDPTIGAFLRVAEKLQIPKTQKIYSCNEGNRLTFEPGYAKYLDWAQQNGYSTRYSGTMVADVHRILVKGGVFLYPPTKKAPEGKLRLMYEANPMAMLIEQAGGKAFAGKQRILDLQPQTLHQRTTVVLGSPDEVDHVMRHL